MPLEPGILRVLTEDAQTHDTPSSEELLCGKTQKAFAARSNSTDVHKSKIEVWNQVFKVRVGEFTLKPTATFILEQPSCYIAVMLSARSSALK